MKTKNKSQSPTSINRRNFLGLMATTGAGLCVPSGLFARGKTFFGNVSRDDLSPVDSPPVLQCPSETSIAVVWAVNRPATGCVIFGTRKDSLDRTAYGEVFGQNPYNERFLQIRLRNLQPNTRYYYRTVTRMFEFSGERRFEVRESFLSDVFSFETTGENKSSGSFSVINDTHNNQATLKRLTERLALVDSDYTVWNGDLVDGFTDADTATEAVLRPGDAPFAAEKPMLFVPGNHDYRGVWARNTGQIFPEWEHADARDRVLGRNFVVRTGPLALIGLDTGEDKPDNHPAWGGLARFEPYREAQRDWLNRALQSPEVATAPFVAAFCHIPLLASDPNDNGGDLQTGFAAFQRQAANLWGPLLSKHGVQCLIAAHRHRFAFAPATSDRSWAQIRGGGHRPDGEITVIHGKTIDNHLEVVVDDLNSEKELGRWKFHKRNV